MKSGDASLIKVHYNYPVPMRDGTILRTNIFRPDTDGKYPVLLNRTPYCKELMQNIIDPLEAVRLGYVVAIQDTRGRYCSDGKFYPFINEIDDGYDTVERLAEAPWSNGEIGMFGTSYGGITQWFAAVSNPPHLKTIIPYQSSPDLFFLLTGKGIFKTSLELSYSLLLSVDISIKKKDRISEDLIDGIDNMEKWFENIPEKGDRLLKDTAPFYFDWHDNPFPDDDYWKKIDVTEKIKDLKIPILCVGGWYDIFTDETIKFYEILKKHNPEKVKMIMGPWDHSIPFDNIIGEVNFGLKNSYGLYGMSPLLFKWFDKYLKGINNEIDSEPDIRLFEMSTNKWHAFESLPSPEKEKVYYLDIKVSSQGKNNYILSGYAPADEEKIDLIFDPDDPVPSLGGLPYFSPSGKAYNQGAYDQQQIEKRSDVISFSTDTLETDITIMGKVIATIFASTPLGDMDLCLKLIDVYPDGKAINLMESITRGSFVAHLEDRQFIPGKIQKFEIDLSYTFIKLEKGHMLRLDIACSNFPSYELVKNVCKNNEISSSKRTVNNILIGGKYKSRILIPLKNS